MNGVPKPVYTIQETPKGEWHLKKGGFSYGLFPTEQAAIDGMERVIRHVIKEYDEKGKPMI